MNAKKYYRAFGKEDTYDGFFPSYEESVYLRDTSTRMDAVNESWKQFKKKRPFCSKLLIALFGEDKAKEAHLDVKPFSETKALLALNELKSEAISSVNPDSRHITPCKRDS